MAGAGRWQGNFWERCTAKAAMCRQRAVLVLVVVWWFCDSRGRRTYAAMADASVAHMRHDSRSRGMLGRSQRETRSEGCDVKTTGGARRPPARLAVHRISKSVLGIW